MTVDEFKSELSALMERVDDELADSLMRETGAPRGTMWEVSALFPRIPRHGAKKGTRMQIRLDVTACFTPVEYEYGDPH